MAHSCISMTCCGFGALLIVIAGVMVGTSWHKVSATLEQRSWMKQSGEGKSDFTIPCGPEGAPDMILLFQKKADEECNKQYNDTTVTFSKVSPECPATVPMNRTCGEVMPDIIPTFTTPAPKGDGEKMGLKNTIEVAVRRLGAEMDIDAVSLHQQVLQATKDADLEYMADFVYYVVANQTMNGTLNCVEGSYTVKSSKPVWALSVMKEVEKVAVGIFTMLAALIGWIILCCAGACCASAGCLIAVCS